MQKNLNQRKIYYFSEKLKQQLEQISYHPVTVIEAPSGFGKTTAVREYLKQKLTGESYEFWYTCLGEQENMAWESICDLISNVNAEAADRLKSLGMPTAETLMYVRHLLKDFYSEKETYLVIDNYQLVNCEIPYELMSAFSMHRCPYVHMIFITQNLNTKKQITFHNDNVHTIDSSVLFFDKESTKSLFRMEGIRLTDGMLNHVYSSTEGWVAAIRLQIINYKETGSFNYTADIERLVKTAVWDKLTAEEKEFLLIISVKESFTAKQAAHMIEKDILPESIKNLLNSNDFIKFFPDKSIYSMHSILLGYLRNQFYQHQPEEFQKFILHLAGRCCAGELQLLNAAKFFMKVRDYEAILALPFDGTYITDQGEKDISGLISELIDKCPEGILYKYPFAILLFAYIMLFKGNGKNGRILFDMIDFVIETNKANLSQKELKRLKGEYLLLKSLTAHNDIKKMGEGAREALKILDAPSSIILKDMPWNFGCVSIMCLFWREPGKLDEALRDIEEFLPYHLELTYGQGTGADAAMKAEVMFMRGEDEKAEILCHKALYEARSEQQISICLCAELILARIAILRGDVNGYLTAVKSIQNYAKEDSEYYVVRMVNLCLSVIDILLDSAEKFARYFEDMESIKKIMYAPAIPYFQILYSYFLLNKMRYKELCGLSQTIVKAGKNMNYIFSQVYHLIFLTIAKLNSGSAKEALEYFKEALDLAIPDRIYLPFALQWGALKDLLESMNNSNESYHVSSPHTKMHKASFASSNYNHTSSENRNSFLELITLCKRQAYGKNIIKKFLQQTQSPLTPREREVALLARDRYSKKDIASKLYISEKTVKTILQNIYYKLDIHSKSDLSKMELL
ncbi:HTH-type transcriptional regulator MalT [Oxobacter pfennigii]|uniref:HTH-type transcriptional regulator MalT n=1 Tax=Oxobacter pfennigii TaxID=36849 RepID=A0A0P8W4P9_9CLOT|nr:LuxR C-terminal-related transcriptional regulator [Oxobacter pfennigii]KPU43558.1 HTH-type transcriptional regulator MalT [Oxobacter pfennigii]